MASSKIRNVGPKSAAWLRQIGVRTTEDLSRVGPVEAFLKVKRAGLRPSLNLLYAMAGALADCHWADLPEERKQELLAGLEAAESANPIRTRWEKQKAASERASNNRGTEDDADAPAHGESSLFDSPDGDSAGESGGGNESDPGGMCRFD
ncbi:MAG TPA: TfoX/Sxy family protein [Rhodanobacteraceae bacterium]|nr:TfoX/Sxy family protein [Rhodanobacteraceae bacterium]